MPTLRAEIADLKRRLIALEARQLAWRHNAAATGSPEAGASYNGPAFDLTDGMRVALETLWQRSVHYGQPFAQVSCSPCEDGTVAATAYFRDGTDTEVYFDKPENFDALACGRAFEAHLNVR